MQLLYDHRLENSIAGYLALSVTCTGFLSGLFLRSECAVRTMGKRISGNFAGYSAYGPIEKTGSRRERFIPGKHLSDSFSFLIRQVSIWHCATALQRLSPQKCCVKILKSTKLNLY
jgi:hypothetical protein